MQATRRRPGGHWWAAQTNATHFLCNPTTGISPHARVPSHESPLHFCTTTFWKPARPLRKIVHPKERPETPDELSRFPLTGDCRGIFSNNLALQSLGPYRILSGDFLEYSRPSTPRTFILTFRGFPAAGRRHRGQHIICGFLMLKPNPSPSIILCSRNIDVDLNGAK